MSFTVVADNQSSNNNDKTEGEKHVVKKVKLFVRRR